MIFVLGISSAFANVDTNAPGFNDIDFDLSEGIYPTFLNEGIEIVGETFWIKQPLGILK